MFALRIRQLPGFDKTYVAAEYWDPPRDVTGIYRLPLPKWVISRIGAMLDEADRTLRLTFTAAQAIELFQRGGLMK